MQSRPEKIKLLLIFSIHGWVKLRMQRNINKLGIF